MQPTDTNHMPATDDTAIERPADGTDQPAEASEAERIAALEAEKTDLREKLLRTLADMENLRRRTEREVADARTYGASNFARDMLSVADNLRRALDSVPEEARAAAEGSLKALTDGVELTERDLINALERHGVRRIDPKGQKFDPHLHQAMFEVPNPNVPNGTVVEVVQPGFTIGDRVLRPALVGVAKGGPKAAPAGEQTASQPNGAAGA